MINYIKTAFTKPKEIYIGRNMKNSHFFAILFSLVAILTLFSLADFYPAAKKMTNDITEVKQAIPDFTLENDTLESETESFIYQTDTFMLYFDPDNKMSTETINRNMKTWPVPVAIGLLNEELSLNVMGQTFTLPYADLSDFTTADLKQTIASFGQVSPGFIFLFAVFLFLFNFTLYLMQFFPIVLFANIISVYRRTNLRFFQTIKMALLATIPPILALYAIDALLFDVYFLFELFVAASIVIYYLSISEMKKRINRQKSSEE